MKKKIITRLTAALFLVCVLGVLIAGAPLMYNQNIFSKNTQDESTKAQDTEGGTEAEETLPMKTQDNKKTEAPPSGDITSPPSDMTDMPITVETKIPEDTTALPETELDTKEPTITPTPTTEENEELMITVYLESENKYVDLSIEEYVTGVVLSEMSYLSPDEALRAQAVAARTYCLRRSIRGSTGHESAQVCNNASHCMSYRSKDEILTKYGEEKGNEIWQKVNKIVLSTNGEYLTCNGEVISAMFHDSSAGCTESAENLYGNPKQYLVCVKTPEQITEYSQTLLTAEVIKRLFESTSELEDISCPVGKIDYYSDSGRCCSVEIFGKKFSALEVFLALGLRSMDFDLSYENNNFVFVCRGYGHGLGMSQKGAKVYAEAGLDYREILMHYYKNCEIRSFDKDGIPSK